MAVTSTFKRVRHSVTVPTFDEIVTATLSGTYATGGFTWKPFAIVGNAGSSPLQASALYGANWISPKGYLYITSLSGTTATTKIFTAPETELADTTAVPDTSLTVILSKGR
jgi:hypothetical protein